MSSNTLAGSALGDVGNVDLFGLDEFGQEAGLPSKWGAAIVGGIGTTVAIAARQLKITQPKVSEGVGFLAGAAAAGIMMAMPSTRAAGWAGMITAIVTNGLRQIEAWFMGPVVLGLPTARRLNGVVAQRINGAPGLGLPAVQQVQRPVGLAGPQLSSNGGGPPVDLVQQGALPANAQHVQLLGGRTLSGLGAHYGVTLFGARG